MIASIFEEHARQVSFEVDPTDRKDDYDAAAVAGCDGGKSDLGSCPHPPDFGHS